ncbi:hypothetical protein [Mesorhizobium atlanticum]|uniref:Apea-like HEPN domain-containing protein n=1 Tax=Mesorhizobium atlanticum TaxID=2233532 RepID=A0A330GVS0_9HYPH|nr:hypothetical protein [Mesorhizobium atlanticum]RAZ78439.1 hypothetical protein DPM35_07685 [Mesorhizobium atlanticum]
MIDWIPMVVLPNAVLREAIDMADFAMVPPSDARVKAACRRQPRLRKFLHRFTDAFGQKIEPAVLMIREDAPMRYRGTAPVAGFRDAVAISTLTGGRATMISHNAGMRRPIWAESFAIYPWMLDRLGEDLIANTPSMMGVHTVDLFHGQSFAGFSPAEVGASEIDRPLFEALSRCWVQRFASEDVEWEDRAIFRSLNMAYQACMMPGGQEATFYDIGRLITLWVSAFEILLHTGPNGGSGKIQVMDMLDGADWCDKRLSELAHPVRANKASTKNRTLASSIYYRIDGLRSDFVHGNDVTQDLLVTDNGTNLLHVAACLYRVVLTTKLGIRRPIFADDDEEERKFLPHFSEYVDWKDPQDRHERAILKAAALPEADP